MKRFLACLLLFLLAAGSISASDDLSITLEGIRVYWFGFVPTGVDLRLTYSGAPILDGLDTKLFFQAGGGYEEATLWRNTNGTVYSGPVLENLENKYMQPNLRFEGGIIQGLLWNEALDKNLLEAFLVYRLRYDNHIPHEASFIEGSIFSDAEGILGNSLFAGLMYHNLEVDKRHKTKNGLYAEASLEWGPQFLFNESIGGSDYFRMNATAKGFIRLFDLNPEKEKNTLSIYLADLFSVDWMTGGSIPIYAFQTFGGTKLRGGLGGSVRGYEKRAWDANFKMVNNLEIRVNGPALFLPSLVPGILAYFDAGYAATYFADAAAQPSFLAATGAGIYLNVFDFDYLAVYFQVPLTEERKDGKAFSIAVELGLHF